MWRRLVAMGVAVCCANVVPTHNARADMGALVDASGAPTQAQAPMRYLALGTMHTCVVMADAALRCFGDSSYGQLGLGAIREVGASTDTTGSYLAVGAAPATALGAGVRQVVAGAEHTCALLTTGAVKCWGRGALGRLGYGDETTRGTADSQMGVNLPTVDLGTGRTAIALAAGSAHTCALLDNATVKCWGDNVEGQLGLGDRNARGDGPGEMGDALPAVAFAAGRSASAIAAGGNHSCAILDNDALVCWGANTDGQLGQGSTDRLGDNESVATIAAVPVGGVRAVALGDAHTCVITTAAAMKCFGSGGNGRLGTDATDNRGDASGEVAALPAIALGAARSVRAVAAGGSHSCALLDDATVKCFGNGGNGRLGTDDANNRGDVASSMASLASIALGRDVRAIAAGSAHTCALLDDATVKCFGSAARGQIGSNTTTSLGGATGDMGRLSAVALGAPVATASEPTAPRSLTATADDSSATLTWLAPSSDGGSAVTDYIVEYRASGDTAWTRVADGVSSVASATITGLSVDVAYTVRVAAANAVHTGAFATETPTVTPTTTTTTTTTTTVPTTTPAASASVTPRATSPTTSTTTSTVVTTTTRGATPRRQRTAVMVAAFASYSSTLTAIQQRQLARIAATLRRGDAVTCATFSDSDTLVSSAGMRRATAVCRHLRRLVPGLRVRVDVRAPLTAAEERRMGVRGTGLMRRVLVTMQDVVAERSFG